MSGHGLRAAAVCFGLIVASSAAAIVLGDDEEAAGARQPMRRALLIGIQTYLPEGERAAEDRNWSNLEAPLYDVECVGRLLEQQFGFEVSTLTEASATRNGILTAIRERLVEPSKPGDVALLFYAGHGSQVRNEGSSEVDRMDETLVPADAYRGVPDIRDKELRALLAQTHEDVRLILLFDSCHSGTITRGPLAPSRDRRLAPSGASVRVSRGAEEQAAPPEKRNGVRFSACLDDELAVETRDEDGRTVGAFTWAFRRALQTAPPDVTPTELHRRIRGLLAGRGESQHAVLAGPSERLGAPLFGASSSRDRGVRVAVGRIEPEGRRVELQAGTALGLRPGCRLESVREGGPSLLVTEVTDVGSSKAEVTEKSERGAEPGELFTVVKWVAGAAAPLRIWMPTPLPEAALAQVERRLSLAESSVPWIEDPTREPPSCVLDWEGSAWRLRVGASEPVSFATLPTQAQLHEHVKATIPLYLVLPPAAAFAKTLRDEIEHSGRPIQWATRPEDAVYLLAGRFTDQGPAYAWVLREACQGPVESPLPTRTDWTDSALALALSAERLDNVWGWQHLQSPEHFANTEAVPEFPYRLAATRDDRGDLDIDGGGALLDRGGGSYTIVLRGRSEEALTQARKKVETWDLSPVWHCYVGAIDSHGAGALLISDRVVDLRTEGMEVVLGEESGDEWSLGVGPPYGLDTWFLLATLEPLVDSEVLEFSGVRKRSGRKGVQSDLERLLGHLAEGRRGEPQVVPTTWVFDRHHLQSALGVAPSRMQAVGQVGDPIGLTRALDEAIRKHGMPACRLIGDGSVKQRLSGTYRVAGDRLHARVELGDGGEARVSVESEGPLAQPDVVAKQILQEVMERLQTGGG